MIDTVKLLPAQYDFITATEREVLYSGAFGAGKTRGLCMKLLPHAMIPNNLVGLCRKKHTTMRQTTLRTLLQSESGLPPVLPPDTFTHNKSDQVIKLNGGGDIYHFGFDDELKLGSLNFGAIAVDEGIELKREEYEMLLGRLRNTADPCRQIFIATNPGSPGHFLHDRFYKTKHKNRRVINTTSLDNFFLPKDYIESLETLSGTAYDRFVLGKWVAYEGAVYPQFATEHIVHNKGKIHEALVCIDWGFTNPFCALVFTRIGVDTIHVAEEIYQPGLTQDQSKKIILDIMARYPVYFVTADPSEPASIEAFRRAGIPIQGADNDVIAGIRAVQDRFASGTLLVAPSCTALIRELQSYCWQDGKDQPVKVLDHAVDALRYGVLAWENRMSAGAIVPDVIHEPYGEDF